MDYPVELTQTYEIYEQIGAGGGGTVFKGMHKRMLKDVVIKKLKGTASTSIQDCRTEVDILKNLRHSYLPQVIDFIESSEGIFTVMDFIPGKSLQNMLDEKHTFTEQEVLKYTRQLCEALDYLHSKNPPIVHGDIKPDNIMITPEGNVCLIDFNISGALEGKGATTFGFTPGYSAPEQAEAFEKIKRQMQGEDAQKKGNKKKKSKKKAKQKASGAKTASLKDDKEKTVLMEEDREKTVLLEEDSEKTVLLEEDSEKTVLLEEDSEKTVLLDEDMDGTILLGEDATSISTEQQKAWQEAAAAREGSRSKVKLEGISIDKRSDIYSLGATIYSLLTGRVRNPKDRRLVLPDVSSGFKAILARALAYSPDRRYQDAGKMLQAVLSVHKMDKKYKGLLRRQKMTMLILVLMLGASVYCIYEGSNQMTEEVEEKYDALVAELRQITERGDTVEAFNEVYTKATALFPHNMDAYYETAVYMLEQQGAEAAANYIDEVMTMPLTEDTEVRGNLYYLYGDCYFQMENYEKAAFYYERAIKFTSSNEEIYRDYAVALAYLGEHAEAEKILEIATSYGLARADVLMVQGEIARMTGQREKALECFDGVIAETRDDKLMQRAYVMASKTFEAIGTEAALLESIDWLNKAVKELGINSRAPIYECLEQNYMALGKITGDSYYYDKAVDTMEEIISMGWDTDSTYNDAVLVFQRQGNLDEATLWAGQMKQKYPDHYATYIRLCSLEAEKQKQKESTKRSYENFAEYYQKAEELYKQQKSGNITNEELLRLEQIYDQLVIDGMLK